MISPVIRRLQPELNEQQLAVVSLVEGPLLVIAGPGSGKTRCIVWRAVNLLLLDQVEPSQLVLCTFSRRAAHELRQRFDTAARAAGCSTDLADVRIATVHSLCHAILSKHGPSLGLRPNLALLDQWQQLDLLGAHFHRIFGPDRETLRQHGWRTHEFTLGQARKYLERIAEEGIDPAALADSDNPFHAALGRCCRRYDALLHEVGALDLSRLQVQTLALLQDENLAGSIGSGIRHLMVDEYQDTSYVQGQVLFALGSCHDNVFAVGDDDQSIYRFRGASLRCLQDFTWSFPFARVKPLTVNHRSHSGIVEAYDRWMASADWNNPDPGGEPFRHHKTIVAHAAGSHADYPSVIRVLGNGRADEARQLAHLLASLKGQGVITDYGQVALLLHSVRETVCRPYLRAFEDAGIRHHLAPAASSREEPIVGETDRRASPEAAFPTGRAVVTTIHQAKGLEWPVVVVGSLDDAGGGDRVGRELAAYIPGPTLEHPHRLDEFDRMRQHYVAFSRPQGLLVLTASKPPAARFAAIWDGLPCWSDMDNAALDRLFRQRFGPARPVNPSPTPRDVTIHRVKRLELRTGGLTILRGRGG